MAALEDDHLVVRLVYTGPPMAGKTQSVRALLPLLDGPGARERVLSPEESKGRTAFFDWASYEGGAFEGRSIRCHIVSTPGQVALSDRRELIIRGADAIILVVDSQPEALERAIQCYEEMAPWLADSGRHAPIRLLLQCNKQDVAGCLGPEELNRALGLPFGKDVYPTSARTGKGLRAAFVAGVRAAVERARELLDAGLTLEAPEIGSGEQLLERMKRDIALHGSVISHGSVSAGPPLSRPKPSAPADAVTTRPREGAATRAPPRRHVSATSPKVASTAPSSGPRSRPPAEGSQPGWARLQIQRPLEAPSAGPRAAAPEAQHSRRPQTEPSRAAPPVAGEAARPSGFTRVSARVDSAAHVETAVDRSPQSSTRPAVPPTRSLLEGFAAVRGDPPLRSVTPRLRLDPAGQAARDWRPESGARPAVMPAAAYHALVPPSDVEASAQPAPALKTLPRVGLPPPGVAAAPAHRAPYVPGGVRPAVMPASAYYATLPSMDPAQLTPPEARTVTALEAVATPASERVPAAARPSPLAARAGARPAVMPASAYYAALQAGGATGSVEARSPARAEEPPALAKTASAEPAPARAIVESRKRPAVMPASAWLASRLAAAAQAEQPSDLLHAPVIALARAPVQSRTRPAVMPASAWLAGVLAPPIGASPPRARAFGKQGGVRPAVMPASAWRASLAPMLLSVDAVAPAPSAEEPPTLPSQALHGINACAADAGEGESSAGRSSLDPARADEPMSESFRIPETPPGLQALAVSSVRPDALSSSSTDAQRSPPPRLPGHAQAPRSVWRRPAWRMLETQLTQDGRALEDAPGRWIGELAPGWYARTLESASDLRSARRAFAREVLRQRSLGQYLSRPRCIALTEEPGGFWVWQIACRVPTLAATLGRLLATPDAPSTLADALIEAAVGYLDARQRFAEAPEPLPLSLHALSVRDGTIVYAGLLPDSGSTLVWPRGDSNAAFGEALRKKWPESPEPPVDVLAVVAELQRKAVGRLPEPIVEIIRGVVVRN